MDPHATTGTRREFVAKLLMGGGLVAVGALFVRHVVAFVLPRTPLASVRKLLVGRVDELQVGQAKEFQIGDRPLYLVRTEDGFKVFSAICTHLGCKTRWEPYKARFYCPCHKGAFDASGNVTEGPPPRPLDQFKVDVEKSLVYMWLDEHRTGGAA